MQNERFTVRLPSGLQGIAELRIDPERLTQDLAWKAYYSARKRASLKNGAIIVVIKDDGTTPKAQT